MQSQYLNNKADEIIRNHIIISSGAGLVPIPVVDILAVSAVHLNMLRQLAKIYDVDFAEEQAKSLISSVAGSALARLGASLVKSIPVIGTFLGGVSMSAMSGAATYALGQVFKEHFGKGGNIETVNVEEAKKTFESEFERGKEVAVSLKEQVPVQEKSLSDQSIERLEKLAELKEKGILTAEEFDAKKTQLLDLI